MAYITQGRENGNSDDGEVAVNGGAAGTKGVNDA
jgi:hypothetical protein